MHIYEQDYRRLLNKFQDKPILLRHTSVDKLACVEMNIYLIIGGDISHAPVSWYKTLSILLTQYYIHAVPHIKDLDIFKRITVQQLKAFTADSSKIDIEEYVSNRKELISYIEQQR